jgi:nitrate reductase NapD
MSQTKQNNREQEKEITHEYHVASLVAYTMPEQVSDVEAAITAIEGAEIHATSDKGKIVLTIEGDSHKGIGKKMDLLRVHKGLINLSPVYHQVLDEKIEGNSEENYQEIN